jgi:hypothetical protein
MALALSRKAKGRRQREASGGLNLFELHGRLISVGGPPMNESAKRIFDWLTLPFLGLPAAVIWIAYINNTQPSMIWIALLIFDIPFAAAALIWLGWRFLIKLPKTEITKNVIDWLTLIPLGYMPATLAWILYTHNNQHPSPIASALLLIHLPFVIASIVWLALRAVNDKREIAHWFIWGWLAIVMLLLLLVAPHKHEQTW